MTNDRSDEGWHEYHVGELVKCPGHRRRRHPDTPSLLCTRFHGRVSKGTIVRVRMFRTWQTPAPGLVQVCHSCGSRYEVQTLEERTAKMLEVAA